MPIYEYKCGKCGEFEVMQRISDRPLEKCPTCGRKVSKLISSTSFQLKGSGWYITDYARKGAGAAAKDKKKADTSTSEEKSKGDTPKSDTPKSETSTKSKNEKTAAA